MIVLAVDTATRSGSAALLEDDRLLAEAGFAAPISHSARLLRAVDFLLRASGLDAGRIDGYAVAAGPGSFTGIRIGLGTVKSLAFASGKPAAAVSVLRALALKLSDGGPDLLCPFLDAKKGEVYAALFARRGHASAETILPEGAYDPADLLDRFPPEGRIGFIGSGASVYGDLVRSRLGPRAEFSARSAFAAAEVGRLGRAILAEGRGVGAARLEPIYYRRSQAEERLPSP